jgi:ElaB/YqjD/DUF883 family membrane-anchored ribosome-binding protein
MMAEDHNTAPADDLDRVAEDSMGMVEDFIRTRPLTAVAIAMTAGALLARRLFRGVPNDVG